MDSAWQTACGVAWRLEQCPAAATVSRHDMFNVSSLGDLC